MSHTENPESAWFVSPAAIEIDRHGVPRACEFADVYYSADDGLAETRHVFIEHNHLAQRWQQLTHEHREFVIIETGFGTGLNFLAAAELWLASAPQQARLRFISIEKFPLTREAMTQVTQVRGLLAELSAELLQQYPPLLRGHHNLLLAAGRIHLQLIFDDAIAAFTQLLETDYPAWPTTTTRCADAFFLDGFAPAKNPAMWSCELFQSMARLSKPGTTFATFTSAGDVRRGLAAAGFDVQKVAGFGRKRDMLCGRWPERSNAHCVVPSPRSREKCLPLWALTPSPPPTTTATPTPRHALVIGAGLAGAHTAHALAIRGWQVTVADAASEIASAASGNAQGVLYTKLSAQPDYVSRFALTSYVHAIRLYRQLHAAGVIPDHAIDFCGVLYAGFDDDTRALQAHISNVFEMVPELVQTLDATQASAIAGIPLSWPALWMSDAGYAVPHAICRALLDHPGITLALNTHIDALHFDGERWIAQTSHNTALHAGTVIICAASDTQTLQQTAHLPLKAVRGQTTQLPASALSNQLRCVICHDGYLPPARNQHHCIGATFDTRSRDTRVSAHDHADNLARLAQHIPALAEHTQTLDTEMLGGRAALRCATPDYLPVVGPVSDVPELLTRFAPLADNANTLVAASGAALPGLYVNTAHGSRGLSSTPIAAELIAAYVDNTPFPLPAAMRAELHPARFVIRDLIRKRRVAYT